MSTYATCDHCARLRKLTSAGLIAHHYTRVPERVRGTERTRKLRRLCPGSGQRPRRAEP